MQTDLVLSSFNADLRDAVVLASTIDQLDGIDGLWTYDHFSGSVVGANWSSDPFVTLGALAAVTTRVGLGVLVANMVNRHPAQLASAINSLQRLAPGRVICGVGSGAAPGSRFAVEHDAIGRTLGDAASRAGHLAETIHALRATWRGDSYSGEHVELASPAGLLDAHPPPPIIVGASSTETIALAADHADGVNIRAGAAMADHVRSARERSGRPNFEISVMVDLDPAHPLGGDPEPLIELGVDRRILAVNSPFPREVIVAIAHNLVTRQAGS